MSKEKKLPMLTIVRGGGCGEKEPITPKLVRIGGKYGNGKEKPIVIGKSKLGGRMKATNDG